MIQSQSRFNIPHTARHSAAPARRFPLLRQQQNIRVVQFLVATELLSCRLVCHYLHSRKVERAKLVCLFSGLVLSILFCFSCAASLAIPFGCHAVAVGFQLARRVHAASARENHCHATSRYFFRRGTHATRNILHARPGRQMLVIFGLKERGKSLKFPSVNTQMGLFILRR